MKDLIDRKTAIKDIRSLKPKDAQLDAKWVEMWLKQLPSAHMVTVCKDCKNWIPGYITDHDDFIPPKCGKYHQYVGHSSDDYCSMAERKDDE